MQRDDPENPICIGLLMLLGQPASDDSESMQISLTNLAEVILVVNFSRQVELSHVIGNSSWISAG